MAGLSERYYDVVIVGAGPAGSNLARLLDNKKYKVLLLDGSDNGEKVCGGLLSPDAQDIFARYDINLPGEVLASPQLFTVKTIDLADGLVKHYRRSYLNVDRSRFDEFLKKMASAEIVRSRCVDVTEEKTGFILSLEGELNEKIRCKYLIGADGASSVVRRKLFGDRKIYKYIAIQQWFDAGDEKPYYACVFDNATSSGCSWIFFKDGKLVFGGAFEKQKGRESFEAQKQKLIDLGFVPKERFMTPLKTEACLVNRPKIGKGIFMGGGNAFLVGEAAGLISPSSFEGISFALMSGEMLAESMNKYDRADVILRKYKKSANKLKVKAYLRVIKRPFMYNGILRHLVMKSGIQTVKLK